MSANKMHTLVVYYQIFVVYFIHFLSLQSLNTFLSFLHFFGIPMAEPLSLF